MTVWAWLLGHTRPDYVTPWDPAIADRHAADTARMLLGACGPVQVVGSRRDEAVLADRERRLAEMARRQRTAGVMRFERRLYLKNE